MGKVRTGFIKRTSEKIYNRSRDEISEHFEENKKIIEKHADFPSKRLRNLVAGYITKLKKNAKKRGE